MTVQNEPTHSLSLTVTVDGPEQWQEIYEVLSRFAKNLGAMCPNVTLSSYLLDTAPASYEEGETFSEDTLAKVRVALRETGMPELMIPDAITAMQNNGILFRERS